MLRSKRTPPSLKVEDVKMLSFDSDLLGSFVEMEQVLHITTSLFYRLKEYGPMTEVNCDSIQIEVCHEK